MLAHIMVNGQCPVGLRGGVKGGVHYIVAFGAGTVMRMDYGKETPEVILCVSDNAFRLECCCWRAQMAVLYISNCKPIDLYH